MNFGAYKTSVEVIKEDAFGGAYFRNIYSDIAGKWYRKSWKEFDQFVLFVMLIRSFVVQMLLLFVFQILL